MNKKEVLEEMQYQIEKGNVLSDSLKLRIKTIKRRRKQESSKRRLLQQRIDKALGYIYKMTKVIDDEFITWEHIENIDKILRGENDE